MLRIGFKGFGVVVCFSLFSLIIGLAPSVALAAQDRTEICLHSNELLVNETIRDASLGESEMFCFTTFIAEAGYWALEATVPGSMTPEPRLDFFGAMCEPSLPSTVSSYRTLQRTAASVVVEVLLPGDHTFCVMSQDPLSSLAELRIENRFAVTDRLQDGDPKEEEVDPDPLPSPSPLILPSDGDPKEEEVDPDPGGNRASLIEPLDGDPKEEEVDPDPRGNGWGLIEPLDGDPKEEEVDPDPGGNGGSLIELFDGDPKEEEVDPDPMPQPSPSPPPGSGLSIRDEAGLRDLCATGDQLDDHGDLAICATPLRLGGVVDGTLDGWAGDEDLFAFELTTMLTVTVETAGWTDTEGALYDAWGQRLASALDGGEGENFRLVKTLPPGRYLLRVAGQGGAAGAYRLILRDLDI